MLIQYIKHFIDFGAVADIDAFNKYLDSLNMQHIPTSMFVSIVGLHCIASQLKADISDVIDIYSHNKGLTIKSGATIQECCGGGATK